MSTSNSKYILVNEEGVVNDFKLVMFDIAEVKKNIDNLYNSLPTDFTNINYDKLYALYSVIAKALKELKLNQQSNNDYGLGGMLLMEQKEIKYKSMEGASIEQIKEFFINAITKGLESIRLIDEETIGAYEFKALQTANSIKNLKIAIDDFVELYNKLCQTQISSLEILKKIKTTAIYLYDGISVCNLQDRDFEFYNKILSNHNYITASSNNVMLCQRDVLYSCAKNIFSNFIQCVKNKKFDTKNDIIYLKFIDKIQSFYTFDLKLNAGLETGQEYGHTIKYTNQSIKIILQGEQKPAIYILLEEINTMLEKMVMENELKSRTHVEYENLNKRLKI